MREIVRAFPGHERVAVIGTGGLSHEPGGPRYFWVDEEFDRWFLDLLKAGDHAALLRECTLERMEAAGSGGTAELLAWILALAFTTGPADVLAYMPAVAWRSGTGMVVWNRSPPNGRGDTRRCAWKATGPAEAHGIPTRPPRGRTRRPP